MSSNPDEFNGFLHNFDRDDEMLDQESSIFLNDDLTDFRLKSDNKSPVQFDGGSSPAKKPPPAVQPPSTNSETPTSAEQPVEFQPPVELQPLAGVQQPRDVQASTDVSSAAHVQKPEITQSSSNVQEPAESQLPADAQSSSNVQEPAEGQSPANTQPSSIVREPAESQLPANTQPSSIVREPAQSQLPANAQSSSNVQESAKAQPSATAQRSTFVQPPAPPLWHPNTAHAGVPQYPVGSQPLVNFTPPDSSKLLFWALQALQHLQQQVKQAAAIVSECQHSATQLGIYLSQLAPAEPSPFPFTHDNPSSVDMFGTPQPATGTTYSTGVSTVRPSDINDMSSTALSGVLLFNTDINPFFDPYNQLNVGTGNLHDLLKYNLPNLGATAPIDPYSFRQATTEETIQSVDLSRNPRPGAKNLLAAKKASENARSGNHAGPAKVDQSNVNARSSLERPAEKNPRQRRTSDTHLKAGKAQEKSRPSSNIQYHSLAGSCDKFGNFYPSEPNHPGYIGPAPPNSVPTAQITNSYAPSQFAQYPRGPSSGTENNPVNADDLSQSSPLVAPGHEDASTNRSTAAGPSRSGASRKDIATAARAPPKSVQARLAKDDKVQLSSKRRPRSGEKVSTTGRPLSQEASSLAHASHSDRTSQAPPDEGSRRRRRSSGSQGAAVDESRRTARPTASSRLRGPVDAIPGMIPAAGADRILPLQRGKLPKGNIRGKPYSCEAKCGYTDDATLNMILCDSAYHRRQRQLQLLDSSFQERGWYHRACGGLDPSSPGDGAHWICPACVQRRTTSTDDENDDDDDGLDDKPAPDDVDDSEDEYQPDQETPGEDSDDGEGAGYTRDNANSDDDNGDRDNGVNHESGAGESNSVLNEGNVLNEDNEEQGSNQQQRKGKKNKKEHVDDPFADLPPIKSPVLSKSGSVWSEWEKELAIRIMAEVIEKNEIHGELRFVEVARQMRLHGCDRQWMSVKNAWNRGLREQSGLDERKNKNAPLTTSRQGGERKKKNAGNRPSSSATESDRPRGRTTKQQRSKSTKQQLGSTQTQGASPKRGHDSDDEDEVIPPKRRRPSPYDGDRFDGLY